MNPYNQILADSHNAKVREATQAAQKYLNDNYPDSYIEWVLCDKFSPLLMSDEIHEIVVAAREAELASPPAEKLRTLEAAQRVWDEALPLKQSSYSSEAVLSSIDKLEKSHPQFSRNEIISIWNSPQSELPNLFPPSAEKPQNDFLAAAQRAWDDAVELYKTKKHDEVVETLHSWYPQFTRAQIIKIVQSEREKLTNLFPPASVPNMEYEIKITKSTARDVNGNILWDVTAGSTSYTGRPPHEVSDIVRSKLVGATQKDRTLYDLLRQREALDQQIKELGHE